MLLRLQCKRRFAIHLVISYEGSFLISTEQCLTGRDIWHWLQKLLRFTVRRCPTKREATLSSCGGGSSTGQNKWLRHGSKQFETASLGSWWIAPILSQASSESTKFWSRFFSNFSWMFSAGSGGEEDLCESHEIQWCFGTYHIMLNKCVLYCTTPVHKPQWCISEVICTGVYRITVNQCIQHNGCQWNLLYQYKSHLTESVHASLRCTGIYRLNRYWFVVIKRISNQESDPPKEKERPAVNWTKSRQKINSQASDLTFENEIMGNQWTDLRNKPGPVAVYSVSANVKDFSVAGDRLENDLTSNCAWNQELICCCPQCVSGCSGLWCRWWRALGERDCWDRRWRCCRVVLLLRSFRAGIDLSCQSYCFYLWVRRVSLATCGYDDVQSVVLLQGMVLSSLSYLFKGWCCLVCRTPSWEGSALTAVLFGGLELFSLDYATFGKDWLCLFNLFGFSGHDVVGCVIILLFSEVHPKTVLLGWHNLLPAGMMLSCSTRVPFENDVAPSCRPAFIKAIIEGSVNR